jgi:glycosyltransferase involved in cell wall biosynthesis
MGENQRDEKDMMDVSVSICTYNRSKYLPGAIESCLHQSFDSARYEIIVVDNNSSDATRQVLRRYGELHGKVRYVFEGRQGLNLARTRGAREARGRYVAYLDDDSRADPYWLESLLEAFDGLAFAPVCVGGRVCLDWEGPRPEWYPPEFDGLMAYLDHGDRGFYLKPDMPTHFLIGTNMAFERNVVLEIGGFRSEYGRKKRRTISGAETEMIRRLLKQGLPVYYEPKALVTHIVVPERRTKRFLLDRIKGDGATQPLLDLENRDFCESNLLRRVSYDLRTSLWFFLKSLLSRMKGRRRESFLDLLNGIQRWGRLEMELKFLYHREFAPLWRGRWSRLG